MPALKPASTGEEMKSARKPSRSKPAERRMTPVSAPSVAATRSGSSAVCGEADATATAVSAAMVDVVLTESERDVPRNA